LQNNFGFVGAFGMKVKSDGIVARTIFTILKSVLGETHLTQDIMLNQF
jgi:hypothetical protein